jgi:uncharacterized membrane protein (UPF0127 family)
VVFLDRAGTVVAVRQHVRPWRIVLPVAGAHAVLELPARATNVVVGDRLHSKIDVHDAQGVGASLSFLCQEVSAAK